MNPKRAAQAGYRFSVIPAGAIIDDGITPRALQVLCLLGRHTNDNGWCLRSQVRMAEELHCVRSTIQKALDLLECAGYIERRAMGRKNTAPDPEKQPFASYAYRVILDVEGGADISAPPHTPVNDVDDAPDCEPGGADISAGGCHPESARGCRSGSAPHIYNIPLKEHAHSNLARDAARGSASGKPDGSKKQTRPGPGIAAKGGSNDPATETWREQWSRFWAGWQALPGFSPQMSPWRAEKSWWQLKFLHPDTDPAAVVAAVEAYRAYLVRTNAARRRDHVRGAVMIPYPERWLDEGMWRAFAAAEKPPAADAGVPLAKAVQGLGVEGLRRLRAAGLSDAEIREWFSGAEGEEGDPPKIRMPSRFRARYVEDRFLPRLRCAAAFGPKLEIVFTEVRGAL